MKKIKKVLLVDDNKADNYINKLIIKDLDLANEIVIKSNGNEAIQYLNEACKEGHYPDLILLDIQMPGADGFDFLKHFELNCKQLKKDIAIVILTVSHSPEDILRLMEMGNYYFINKPLTTDKFLDIHHRYFRDN